MAQRHTTSNGEAVNNSGSVLHADENQNGRGEQLKAPFPFVFRYCPTRWQRIRFYLMVVFVLPIRSILFVSLVLTAGILSHIALAFHRKDSYERVPRWRRMFKPLIVFLYRALYFVCGVHYITRRGRRAKTTEAPILCTAPHSSHLDPLLGLIEKPPSVLSTKENGNVPLIGAMFHLMEAILIDRSDPVSCERSMNEITRRAQTMGEWPQIISFPEGCCTNRKSLITFKRGLFVGSFMAGLPIQPVLVRYNHDLDHMTFMNSGPDQVTMFLILMCTPNTNLDVEYLPIYHPSEEEKENPDLYAENVRQLMSKHLKIPTAPYTFKDQKEFIRASGPVRSGFLHFLSELWTKGEVVMPSTIPDSHAAKYVF